MKISLILNFTGYQVLISICKQIFMHFKHILFFILSLLFITNLVVLLDSKENEDKNIESVTPWSI